MKVVVDASVALKWVLGADRPEANRSEAAALLRSIGDGVHDAIQPVHWYAEVMAVVARYDPNRTDATLAFLYGIPHEIADDVSLYRRAADLAAKLDHHLFDTLYHAVALELDATLVTADEGYFRKASSLGSLQLLADFDA